MNLFGKKQGHEHEQAEQATRAALDEATAALTKTETAKESALKKAGESLAELQKRFQEDGDPALARELLLERGSLEELQGYYFARVAELTRAKAEAEERYQAASGTATAARLLAGAVTKAKEFGALKKRLESLVAAARKAPLAELRGESMPALADPWVRSELVRLLPEMLGADSDLLALVQAGISAYGRDASGLEKALNVPSAELFDARQFEFYSLAEQSLGDLLAAIKAAHDDLKQRGAAEEKEALRKEKERVAAEEARLLEEERAAIAASLMPGLDRLAEVAAPFLEGLNSEHALKAIEGYGRNPRFAHDARARLVAARRQAPPDRKPLPCDPDDLAWNFVLARHGLLWAKRYEAAVGEDSRIVDVQISEEQAMSLIVDSELKERRKAEERRGEAAA